MQADPIVGLFVGGRGSRLGGAAKGNLETSDGERLLVRLIAVCRAALGGSALTLVGTSDAYGDLGLPALADDPPGVGPIGGLRALLLAAKSRAAASAIALSCDLPRLSSTLVRRLNRESPGASVLAPRAGELWQTLVARYRTAPALLAVDRAIAARQYSLQRVVSHLREGRTELELSESERAELRDCDSPEDLVALGVAAGMSYGVRR